VWMSPLTLAVELRRTGSIVRKVPSRYSSTIAIRTSISDSVRPRTGGSARGATVTGTSRFPLNFEHRQLSVEVMSSSALSVFESGSEIGLPGSGPTNKLLKCAAK
jgi:hypothetical protein